MALLLKTIIQLPATPAATLSATLEIVNDPSGSPASQKMTVQQLVDLLSTLFGVITLYGAGSPIGVLTPTAINQFYRSTTGPGLYQSTGLTSNDWEFWSGTPE